MRTIKQKCSDSYAFDAETIKKLYEIGISPSHVVIGQYNNEDHTIFVYAEENNKYFLDLKLIKLPYETFENYLIKQNQLTALAIKINEIMK